MNQWGNVVKSNNATVDVLFIPEILTNPSDVTVLVGQSTQLTCMALGANIAYQWTKDNVSIPGANSNVLKITNTIESHEGVYMCVASNKAGTVKSNPATVTVYGPPSVVELPQQLHAVLGKEFKIICTATNDQDAPMRLMFSWMIPNGVQFNVTTTDEDDNHTAISILHISMVTHNHSGVYQCIVSNGEQQGNVNSITSTIVVEERSSPPRTFDITNVGINSLQLTWSTPTNPHGRIDYYTVHYGHSNRSIKTVSVVNFTGTYTLDNLRPYTVYSVYVTAVRLIGDTGRPIEGIKSRTITERTLAGVPIIKDDESMIILNGRNSTLDGTFTIELPTITLQHGLFSYLYIIVITDNTITDFKSISTMRILEESMKSHPSFYVAAVVNVNQYVLGNRLSYILGAGDNTTDISSQIFHNRKTKNNYFYYFRIFSLDSTPENEVYVTTEPQKIELPQLAGSVEDDNGGTDSSNASVIANAVLAVLLIVSVVCVIVLTAFVFKLKMQPQATDNKNSVQQPSSAPEPAYELIAKPKVNDDDDDDVNMEKNPAYAVEDTSMDHHYDFIPACNPTETKQ